ncbi:ParB/RepB/Spo0J family partition protein [Tessaracoccus lubricantis]|uniref:ParB/RepB/Spo0J family partition protein n=1 Tax=Tessaracoccus lubricantis TaxID=545543 RepID=A0ABP9FPN6_9ACTN
MAVKNTGLGRGLGDLFARTDGEAAPHLKDGSVYEEIQISKISPNPQQPRTVFDEDDLTQLADSIREFGVLQPVVVRRAGDAFELIMGERRLRASKLAQRTTIPAIIRGTEDQALLRDALLENLHRANLNPIEEARAYGQLLDDFGCTQEELSQRIHRSRPQISNTLRLLGLPERVQLRVAAGTISAGHARALLGLADADQQERLAERIIAEGLSVRSTEEIVALARNGAPARTSAPRGPKLPSEREREISGHLSDHFDTRVKVNIGRNKGKITIEFASGEDLERIMAIMEGRRI